MVQWGLEDGGEGPRAPTEGADCPRPAGLLSPGWGSSPGLQGPVCVPSSQKGR